MYRLQQNITITEDQVKVVKEKFGTVKNHLLAKEIGVNYGKLSSNLRLLGLTKPRTAKIIQMEGYFDINKFGKHYQY